MSKKEERKEVNELVLILGCVLAFVGVMTLIGSLLLLGADRFDVPFIDWILFQIGVVFTFIGGFIVNYS